jgi:hypothetical protein
LDSCYRSFRAMKNAFAISYADLTFVSPFF